MFAYCLAFAGALWPTSGQSRVDQTAGVCKAVKLAENLHPGKALNLTINGYLAKGRHGSNLFETSPTKSDINKNCALIAGFPEKSRFAYDLNLLELCARRQCRFKGVEKMVTTKEWPVEFFLMPIYQDRAFPVFLIEKIQPL